MNCPKCGEHIQEKTKFCAHCGADLVKANMELQLQTLEKANALVAERVHDFEEPADVQVSDKIYVGFWFRALATIIDTTLLQFVVILMILPLAIVFSGLMARLQSPVVGAIGVCVSLGLAVMVHWIWYTVSESSKWQATVGKKMLGLKVTDENLERIGFSQANKRYWAKVLSTLPLLAGYLMIGFTGKKQGLHDRLAKTLVVIAD